MAETISHKISEGVETVKETVKELIHDVTGAPSSESELRD